MNIKKQITISVFFLLLSSCTHIKPDTPKNEVVDTVEYKGQKYLIPIPKDYCRYDPKVKSDQPVLSFLGDLHKEEHREIISLYEESCDVKKKVINGELRDSPRSIEIDVGNKKSDDIEYVTRKKFIDFLYKNIPAKVDKKESKESLIKMYEDLTQEKLLKYGFSNKRSEILREDYKGYADNNNTRSEKEKDNYGFYLFYFGSSKYVSSYSVQSFTKIYNKNVSITITRTLSDANYDRSVEKQIMDEAKNYMKEFVLINDKNDYKVHNRGNKEIKIFTPQGFISPSSDTKKLISMFNEIKFLSPQDKNFKESFIKSGPNELIKMGISLPFGLDINQKYLESRESYIEASYNNMREQFQSRSFNVAKERNSTFFMICDDDNLCSDNNEKHDIILISSTLIKKTPVLIVAEIVSKENKGAIKAESISNLKEDMMSYIDLLDRNQ